MSTLAGRRALLGVSGGIACYKACTVARRLTEAGVQVDVVLTASAAEFIRPLTFEALTDRPVITSLWDRGRALDHVRLGREPVDLIIVAPATAQLIARMAQGMADDFLTAVLLARKAPLLLCPAMNDEMYRHPATQENLGRLAASGQRPAVSDLTVLGPVSGPLAHGEGEGPGRMVEPEDIVAHAERMLLTGPPFAGRHVVVTAGPTREPLDPVRVVTNRSSGRMGYALARAAWRRGAGVTLISGPTGIPVPPGMKRVRVNTTEELKDAISAVLPSTDVLIMAAAPADYQPGQVATEKAKRAAGVWTVALEPTIDVLGSTAYWRRTSTLVVGFALETENLLENARAKLVAKQLDLIVANLVSERTGPDTPTNQVTLIGKDGAVEELPLMSKDDTAEAIVDRVGALLERARS